MSSEIQTIKEREAQIISDVQDATGQLLPPLAISSDRIWAIVFAAMGNVFDKATIKALKNALPSTTTMEDILSEFSDYADTERTQSTFARLNVTGTGTAGETIVGGLSGVNYVSADGQKFYFESSFVVPSDGNISETITAMIPGPQANLSSGELSITAQNANISSTLTIDETDPFYSEGTDIQEFENWRDEVMRVCRRPVLSDNYSYYNATAQKTPGANVVAGYAYVGKPGQVNLYIRTDSDDGTASTEQIEMVQEYFDGTYDGEVRLPAGMEGNIPDSATIKRFNVYSVTVKEFWIKILTLLPNDDETKQKIADDQDLFFKSREPYIKGVSAEDVSVVSVSKLTARIANMVETIGAKNFDSVQLSLDGSSFSSISSYSLREGEIAWIDSNLDNGKIQFL